MINIFKKIRSDPEYKKINRAINTSMCLGSLGLAQILKGTIVAAFPNLLSYFFVVQFFGSTIQGSLSDIYRRLTVLNIALCVLIVTLTLLIFTSNYESSFFNLLRVACIVLIGIGGNADVVGRAEIIDLHYRTDRRKIMSWTVFAEAFSWVVVGYLMRFLNFSQINILVFGLVITAVLFMISIFFNADKTQDKKHLHGVLNELKILIKSNSKFLALITFIIIIGECAYFFFFYNQEDNIKDQAILADSYMSWFIGMSLGCWILSKIKKFHDFVFLMIGLVVSLISILLFVLGGMKDITVPGMFCFDSFVYSIAGLGSGFYLPCFYSMISRGHSIHFQGVLTGWVDSLRVFGDAISNIALLGLALFPSFAAIIISFVLFVATIFIALRYKSQFL